MSFDYNKWEGELRSKVETHEFAFDASAWEEMDNLLSQGSGIIAPKDNTPPASSGRFTSWIISGIIVTAIGLAIWWLINTNNKDTITLSSFNITTPLEEKPFTNQTAFENAPTVAEAGNTSSPKNKQVFPADASPQITKPAPANLATKENSTNNITTAQTLPEKEPLADRSAAYLSPILQRTAVIPLLPTTLNEPVLAPLPTFLKRKRNRRTLYPDVIEQY